MVRVDGALDSENEHLLDGLIRSERRSSALSLAFQRSPLPVAIWLRAVLREKRALLVAILDVSAADAWRLTVVDATRGRALVRVLPTNAASLEAVASILNSAASALQEGLEVASLPLEQVVAEPVAPKSGAPSPTPAPPPAASPMSASPGSTNPARVRARVAAAVTSVADSVSATPGLSASLGIQSRAGLGVDLTAASYFPGRFETALGAFDVRRSTLSLGVGWTFHLPPFRLEPEFGLSGELLRRAGASPVPGVFAATDSNTLRFGPIAGLSLRYPLFSLVSLELAGLAAYYPRRVRFVARSSETYDLAEVSRPVLGARLGLEILSSRE
ncbi:MAG TPA: hypothetical protein VG937_09700 [Polyangiaceae bacterium]|nr:hypothetical protein [Polyangiaceae bacterium]